MSTDTTAAISEATTRASLHAAAVHLEVVADQSPSQAAVVAELEARAAGSPEEVLGELAGRTAEAEQARARGDAVAFRRSAARAALLASVYAAHAPAF